MTLNDVFAKTSAGNGGGLAAFDAAEAAEAAPQFSPVPPGVYAARALSGEYTTTKAGADAYRMRFEITEGEDAGKTVPRLWTFGPKAIGYSKRDLAAFGLTTSAQLLSPFPEPGKEYRVRLVVALQTGDDGVPRNDIKNITVLEAADTPDAEFLLPPTAAEGGLK